jgi:hypothetical protein
VQTQFTDYPRPTTRLGTINDPDPPTGPALRVGMSRDRLDIQASVNFEGLEKLQAMLASIRIFWKRLRRPLSGVRLKIGKVTLTTFVLARISVKPPSQVCQRGFHVKLMFGVSEFQAFLSLQSKFPCCRHGVARVAPANQSGSPRNVPKSKSGHREMFNPATRGQNRPVPW